MILSRPRKPKGPGRLADEENLRAAGLTTGVMCELDGGDDIERVPAPGGIVEGPLQIGSPLHSLPITQIVRHERSPCADSNDDHPSAKASSREF